MIEKFKKSLKKKENIKKLDIILVLVAALVLFGDKIQIGTASIVGVFAGSITTFIIAFMILGIFLIIIPEPTTTLTGILMVFVGVIALIGLGTINLALNSLPSIGGFPIGMIALVGVIIYVFFKRILQK